MARRGNRQDEPGLFDLPLDPPGRRGQEPTGREPAGTGAGPSQPPLFDGGPEAARPPETSLPPPDALAPEHVLPVEEVRLGSGAARALCRARSSSRWLAGLADLAVHVGMALALLF